MNDCFIVITYNPNVNAPVALTDGEDNILAFPTLEKAMRYADSHSLCQAWDYDIFERGMGDPTVFHV